MCACFCMCMNREGCMGQVGRGRQGQHTRWGGVKHAAQWKYKTKMSKMVGKGTVGGRQRHRSGVGEGRAVHVCRGRVVEGEGNGKVPAAWGGEGK